VGSRLGFSWRETERPELPLIARSSPEESEVLKYCCAFNLQAARHHGHMWVQAMEWMIADGDPPMPSVGSVLTGVGIRVRGDVTPADPESWDGVVALDGGVPHESRYRLTGRAGEGRDFDVDTGRGTEHAGAEFLLTVAADQFLVQFDGWARDVPTGSRVTVTGQLSVIGAYEWDDFGLTESRADWLVQAVASADHGDTMLDLAATHDR
jgi:hypothetical protein